MYERPVSTGSDSVGCGCPSFERLHSAISDSQGGAALGWNDKNGIAKLLFLDFKVLMFGRSRHHFGGV
ncbi:hypothetical protein Q4577_22565, partial [Marinovum sp. 2_MG-2023]|nr:hypothetical protein [Marinovum sp. 2_MG-2023]MDO6782106.1 hypothetical protein [Marinovum sp. 1_MG-2023]